MYFLVEYDRSAGALVSLATYESGDYQSAARDRLALEVKLLCESRSFEVVLLEADDEEALRKTHNRYFRNISELAQSPRKS